MKKNNTTKRLRFVISVLMSVAIIVACGSFTSSAEGTKDVPYQSYTYWEGYSSKTPVATKSVYEAYKAIRGENLECGAFKEIQYITSFDNKLYILDSANGRIVILDDSYSFVRIVDNISYNGEKLDFTGAKGLFVDETGLYIADTANQRVICTENGTVTGILTRPDDAAIPETFSFAPARLVRDSSGYFYLLCDGSYYGMMVFTDDYEFCGFFGANDAKGTLSSALKEFITSLFETEEKHSSSIQALPFSLEDICMDSDGFIVTVNGESTGQIRRFGLSGSNTLKKKQPFSSLNTDSYNFADEPIMYCDTTTKYPTYVKSDFCALTAANGFYYAIDGTYGRIFMYDTASNLITVFGGGLRNGDQLGTFLSPSSITVFNGDVLVSDFLSGQITVFRATDYGNVLMQADKLTLKNKYVEAKPYWETINRLDQNCQLAWRGLAKAAIKEEDYSSAMKYAKIGLDRETYAAAFEKVRNTYLSKNFWWIAVLFVIIICAVWYFIRLNKKKQLIKINNAKVKNALRMIMHPLESLKNIKYKDYGSPIIATVLLVLFYISSIVAKLNGGFMFSVTNLSTFNAILTLLGSVGIVLLWTVANWLVCILMEGKGKIKEIYCATCNCLVPIIFYNICYTVFSNIMIPSSNSGFGLLSTVCYLLTAIYLLLSITEIHEFSFFKSMAAAVVILLGMALVAFVLFVMLTLWQDLIGFVLQIANEISLR